jgi:deoxyribodipyrimidine photolyase-related protein
MKTFLILPHQLFDKKHLITPHEYKYLIWEHPHYFKKYKYNKKKLVLHRASMKYYQEYLKNNGYTVQYCEFQTTPKHNGVDMFDPIDKIKIPKVREVFDTPACLLTRQHLQEYKAKRKDVYMFHWFLQYGKDIVDIIPDVKSKDKENRKKYPKRIEFPKLPSLSKTDKSFIEEAQTYVDKHFPKNYGNTANFIFPVTHATVEKWFKHFLKTRLNDFGTYQDAIDKDNDFGFHSCLSSSMNCGLLTPADIITEIRDWKDKVNLNSYEGYIRQLFWREYQRYCYIYFDFSKKKNYFGNRKKLTKAWYEGTTGCEPVDDCIKRGFEQGYLNHIQRLMIMGNYMNLSGINPWEGLRWFIEFSCDSYEWVMYQNVLDMAFCVTGGRTGGGTMQKPYISSSNYVLKMSNYKKGEWSKAWDALYHAFLKKHRTKMLPFKYYFRSL